MIDQMAPDFACTPVSPRRPGFVYAAAGSRDVSRPVATVVTPWYNAGPEFHETAACLLGRDAAGGNRCPGQSLQNFEWVIVNDGSTSPEALALLDQYRRLAREDARIRVLDHPRNRGLPATRNTGWRAARAPLAFFLDADDLIEPTTLEKCALHLSCNPEFAFVKGYSVGFGAMEYLWTRGFHEGSAFLERNLVTVTGMVRTSVLRELGGFDESLPISYEDWALWLSAAAKGHWGDTIPEYLDWYRRRPQAPGGWDAQRQARRERIKASLGDAWARLESAFPTPIRAWHMPWSELAPALHEREEPLHNPLAAERPRALLITDAHPSAVEARPALDLLGALGVAGWESTVALPMGAGPLSVAPYARLTPDVFDLPSLARGPHTPALLDHLIRSRRPRVLILVGCEPAYRLLPYLRARHPELRVIDVVLSTDVSTPAGAAARASAGMRGMIDRTLAASDDVRSWLLTPPRDAEPERVATLGADAELGPHLALALEHGTRAAPRPAPSRVLADELAREGIEHARVRALAEELWAFKEAVSRVQTPAPSRERADPTPLLFGGSRRSGTTWMAGMLNAHPQIECRNEGFVFNAFGPESGWASLPSWLASDRFEAWAGRREAQGTWLKHMSVDEARTTAVRGLWRAIVRQAVDREAWKPWSALLYAGDKTTAHYCEQIDAVHAVFPDGRFLHMLRDGRDVVVSDMFLLFKELDERPLSEQARAEALRARQAHIVDRDAGFPLFGPAVLAQLADDWARSVRGARRARELYGDAFFELRYERVVADPAGELTRVLEWLDVDRSPELVAGIVDQCRFERLSGGRTPGQADPNHDWRKGVIGDWATYFRPEDKRVFNERAGDLLVELGYAADPAW